MRSKQDTEFYNKQRRNVKDIQTQRQAGKREFILRRRSVGRNEHYQKTTGECIRSADCMDTVAMQMVYVGIGGGSEVEGQRYKQGENKDT